MNPSNSLIAIDIGGGTQDILILQDEEPIENSIQMVLPSPTVLLAKRVRNATRKGIGVHLCGLLMGGGPVVWAVKDHLKAGFPVTATPKAAKTIHDSLETVRSIGIVITEEAPQGFENVSMGDIQLDRLREVLTQLEIGLPERWCVAVQDHGECPHGSNRLFRFNHWRDFLRENPRPCHAAYRIPPPYLTRMISVLEAVPGAVVMDTGMAAVQGALCDPKVREEAERGLLIVNLGNQHTLAVLLQGERIVGIFEHHTSMLDPQRLDNMLYSFRKGELSHDEVFQDGGHGCVYAPAYTPSGNTSLFTAVTGPRRKMASSLGFYMAAPFGNMMLSGCFGLVKSYYEVDGGHWPLLNG